MIQVKNISILGSRGEKVEQRNRKPHSRPVLPPRLGNHPFKRPRIDDDTRGGLVGIQGGQGHNSYIQSGVKMEVKVNKLLRDAKCRLIPRFGITSGHFSGTGNAVQRPGPCCRLWYE